MTNTVFASPMKATSTIFDVDWENVEETTEVKKEPKYLEFPQPPLYYVCARIREGAELYTIAEELRIGGNKGIPISKEDSDTADKIYTYFRNKQLMRRLKGEHISDYMVAVEQLCDTKCKVNEEHLPILLTLPKFYTQNLNLEKVMKCAETVDRTKSVILNPFQAELHYVGCVNISTKQQNNNHYFWKTENNKLVRFIIKNYDVSNSVWKYLSKQERIKVNSAYAGLSNIQGYDFHVYTLGQDTEIEAI